MIELIAYLLMLLAQQSATADIPPSIHHAASIAAGEGPISLVGVDGYIGVLCTMRNRLDSPAYPNDLPGVLAAYYAPERTPTDQEQRIAADILLQPGACQFDPRLPVYIYVMSEQDVNRHAWPTGDYVAGQGAYRLHFYEAYPGAVP